LGFQFGYLFLSLSSSSGGRRKQFSMNFRFFFCHELGNFTFLTSLDHSKSFLTGPLSGCLSGMAISSLNITDVFTSPSVIVIDW
jgi:hypothetical protein